MYSRCIKPILEVLKDRQGIFDKATGKTSGIQRVNLHRVEAGRVVWNARRLTGDEDENSGDDGVNYETTASHKHDSDWFYCRLNDCGVILMEWRQRAFQASRKPRNLVRVYEPLVSFFHAECRS